MDAPVIVIYETQELYAKRDENQIYGLLYTPKDAGKEMPAVIFSHGFGGNHQVGAQYAEALAREGYVVYCFDFCGGSPGSRSDGSALDMSIFTEQADLEAVILIHMMQEQPFVLVDCIKEQFETVEDIPDTYYLMWMTVGRAYAENLLDYDSYEAISTYDKDVLLIHGDARQAIGWILEYLNTHKN